MGRLIDTDRLNEELNKTKVKLTKAEWNEIAQAINRCPTVPQQGNGCGFDEYSVALNG